MTFLDGAPDLTATRFSQDDLRRARELLLGVIERHDPGWLLRPVGPLAVHWTAEGTYSATYLIHVAHVLYVLNRSMTAKSAPVLRQKVTELLRAPAGHAAFEDLLIELELGAFLSERVSPISFEPLVPPDPDPAARPRSPDYGIRLPDADICFEVTSVRFGFLDDWDAAAEGVSRRLSRMVLRAGLRREITFSAPVTATEADLAALVAKPVLVKIGQAATGTLTFPVPQGQAHLSWRPLAHLQTDEYGLPIFGDDSPAPLVGATSGAEPGPAAAVEHQPVVEGLPLNEAVVRSLRNSLKAKRKQMTADMPYVLVVHLGHHRIDRSAVGSLVVERLFPNADHRWVSGIAMFAPTRDWGVGAPVSELVLLENDRARHVVSRSLRQLFDGSATFHLP